MFLVGINQLKSPVAYFYRPLNTGTSNLVWNRNPQFVKPEAIMVTAQEQNVRAHLLSCL